MTAPSPWGLCSLHHGHFREEGVERVPQSRRGRASAGPWAGSVPRCPVLPRVLDAVVSSVLWRRRCFCCHQQRATFVGWCQGVKPIPVPWGGAVWLVFPGLRSWSALRRKEPQEEPVLAWAHAPWLPQGPLLQLPRRGAAEVGRRGRWRKGWEGSSEGRRAEEEGGKARSTAGQVRRSQRAGRADGGGLPSLRPGTAQPLV